MLYDLIQNKKWAQSEKQISALEKHNTKLKKTLKGFQEAQEQLWGEIGGRTTTQDFVKYKTEVAVMLKQTNIKVKNVTATAEELKLTTEKIEKKIGKLGLQPQSPVSSGGNAPSEQ